jgi:hypothetical protein
MPSQYSTNACHVTKPIAKIAYQIAKTVTHKLVNFALRYNIVNQKT